VKVWVLSALFLLGCSSAKKEKDFQKSLDAPASADPVVEVQAPPKLLEKFEVAPIEETPKPVETAPKEVKKPTKKKNFESLPKPQNDNCSGSKPQK